MALHEETPVHQAGSPVQASGLQGGDKCAPFKADYDPQNMLLVFLLRDAMGMTYW